MNKVIDFTLSRRPTRPKGDIDCCIRQEALEELLLRRRRAHEALSSLKHLNNDLLWMALNGYPVEPGVHTASPVQVARRPFHTKAAQYWKLAVR